MLLLSHILYRKVESFVFGTSCWFLLLRKVADDGSFFLLSCFFRLRVTSSCHCLNLHLTAMSSMSQKWHFLENKVEGNQRANGWSMEPMTMREQVGGWICVLDSLCCGPWEGMHLQVAMLGQRWELLSYMWITSPASYTFTPHLDNKLLHSTDLWRRHLHADQVSACIASMSEPIR